VSILSPAKIIRITFEYEDRLVVYEGKMAEEAKSQIDGAFILASVHGYKYKPVPFKEFKRVSKP
jgi:hypothetical protein